MGAVYCPPNQAHDLTPNRNLEISTILYCDGGMIHLGVSICQTRGIGLPDKRSDMLWDLEQEEALLSCTPDGGKQLPYERQELWFTIARKLRDISSGDHGTGTENY